MIITFPTSGNSYDTNDFAGRGYITLFFTLINEMISEMQAANTIQGVSPGPAGTSIVSDGSAWVVGTGGIDLNDIEFLG